MNGRVLLLNISAFFLRRLQVLFEVLGEVHTYRTLCSIKIGVVNGS